MAAQDGEQDAAAPPYNVLYIGAGGIVFGNDWVHWNHSQHLERVLGGRLRVVGIVDPSRERFEWVMVQKNVSAARASYADTRHYISVQEAAATLNSAAAESAAAGPVHLIILASPPQFRGSLTPGRDLEAQLVAAFGRGPAIFVEKPVTTGAAEDAYAVARHLSASGNLVGVGYMLRYLRVVQKAKQILRDNQLVVMSITARYITAYARIRKTEWFDKASQGGPIVEQATHFCDLCRYLGGEVVLDSVRATALEHDEPAGELRHLTDAIDESVVPPERRIPRVTAAFWKYNTGAIGTLSHVIALHGITYSNEIDVVADGYQLRLVDLYSVPKLFVRYPHDEAEVEYYYPGDDPFYNELETICKLQDQKAGVAAAHAGNTPEEDDGLRPARILSSFEDATKSYEFSWRIRIESEKKNRD
ncbi:hypothetical protein SPI_06963 [Niveomyces insectorum RCEF 264]|uniref:NAD(P)-binding domain protein n=1 Tax=Niveomyces insectorum RCEF 264 TaxID=1081102 RepID=A0A167QXU5_9HYPO|nr:hypothetical protein SPI_06963 [Niveomyces insectorum RCEF 264]